MTGAPGAEPTLADLWRNLLAGTTVTRRKLDNILEASGVAPQWFDVLHLLLKSENHAIPMTLLAREISMTSGGFTKLADRMATEGLINRRGSSDDRRVVQATLTPKGLELAERAARIYEKALQECLLGVLSPAELEAAAAAARRLADAHATGPGSDSTVDRPPAKRGPNQPERRKTPRTE